MFVQSARFVERHKGSPGGDIAIYGQEKVAETVRLCKMNLAVHGLEGDIREGNTYYEDIHKSVGKFDFVMANPPFNVDKVDKDHIKDDTARFPFGMPKTDNGNYLWIQLFYSSLGAKGRAGFVMANSAADARASEQEIRQKLIKSGAVDVMIAIGSNFFYTVTLPCTLWFFDKGKKNTARKDKVLFIDARNTFTQVDRAHREFTPEQVEYIANIVRLYREEKVETEQGSDKLLKESFPKREYRDVPGLCKVATLQEIEAQGWSLNPGRYVGVAEREADDFDFKEKLEELNEELEKLNAEARELEERISENVREASAVRRLRSLASESGHEDVAALVRNGESETIEFKERPDRETAETAGAFANTRGEVILIGVTDNGDVRGIQIGRNTAKESANEISLGTDPRVVPEVEPAAYEGRTILVVRVAESPLKPVSVRGRCYRRVGNSNRVMTPQDIADMHCHSTGTSWDLMPAAQATLADISGQSVRDYVRLANAMGAGT